MKLLVVIFAAILANSPCKDSVAADQSGGFVYSAKTVLNCLRNQVTLERYELSSFIDSIISYVKNSPKLLEREGELKIIENLQEIQTNIMQNQYNNLDIFRDIARVVADLGDCHNLISFPFVEDISLFMPYCLSAFVEEGGDGTHYAKLIPNIHAGVNWTKKYEEGGNKWDHPNLFDFLISEIDYNGGGNSYLPIEEALKEMVWKKNATGCSGIDPPSASPSLMLPGSAAIARTCFFPASASFIHSEDHSPSVHMKLKNGGGSVVMPWLGVYLESNKSTFRNPEYGAGWSSCLPIPEAEPCHQRKTTVLRDNPTGMPDFAIMLIVLAGLLVLLVIGLVMEHFCCK